MSMETNKQKKIDIGKPKKVHRSIKPKTVKILMGVLEYFAEETRRLNMSNWGQYLPDTSVKYSDSLPPCGTRACLAGGVMLTTKSGLNYLAKNNMLKPKDTYYIVEFYDNTPGLAAGILGLTTRQANKLFYFKGWNAGKTVGWQKKFSDAYDIAKNRGDHDGMFEATKARVFHYIETGN